MTRRPARWIPLVACLALLSACGAPAAAPSAARMAAARGTAPARAASAPVRSERFDTFPATSAQTRAQLPIDEPVGLPAMPRAGREAVAPADMRVVTIARTVTQIFGSGVAIGMNVDLSWTPVRGAATYAIYQERPDGTRRAIVRDQAWRPGLTLLHGPHAAETEIGREAIFVVEALDRTGRKLAEEADNCMHLPPLDPPKLEAMRPGDGAAGPTFAWRPSYGADGHLVEVFGEGAGRPSLWLGYRATQEEPVNLLRFADVGDRIGEASLPASSAQLRPGGRHAWAVCALRTDSAELTICKAVATASSALTPFTP